MNRIVRRSGAPAALFLAALLLAAPAASAAEPAAGVVFDATVEVAFVGEDGAPIVDANVTVVAHITDFPDDEPLYAQPGVTDDEGRATFTGVPRGEAGGPDVYLEVDAVDEDWFEDDNLCLTHQTRSSHISDVLSPPEGPITAKVNSGTSSIECRKLVGAIVDADGKPFSGSGRLQVELGAGGGLRAFEVEVAAGGIVDWPVPVVGTNDDPATVHLVLNGPERTMRVGDCVQTFKDVVDWEEQYALAEGHPEPVSLVAERHVAGETCGSTGGPNPPVVNAPDPPVASRTLPPTDTDVRVGSSPVSSAPAVVVASGLLLLVAAGAVGTRRGSRRR